MERLIHSPVHVPAQPHEQEASRVKCTKCKTMRNPSQTVERKQKENGGNETGKKQVGRSGENKEGNATVEIVER